MTDYLKNNVFLILSFLFIMTNGVLIAMEIYWFSLVPFVIALGLMAFLALDKLMLFIVFATPLSLSIEEFALGGVGMFLPTEPLMFGVMIIFFLRLIYERKFDYKVLQHPITLSILLYLFWVLITTLTSEMILVSFKYLISRLWFIISFYFVGTQLFYNYKNINRFFWLFIIPLFGVVIYTTIHHSMYAFGERSAHWVMQPFLKDHTVYGAVLAFIYPALFYLAFNPRFKRYQLISFAFIIVYTLGLIFSHGRAAWISVVVALLLFVIYRLKIKFSLIFSIALFLGLFVGLFWNPIIKVLEQNNQDSTSTSLVEHIQSISNITTDASNLERINRWKSSFRMFEERPIVGFGPGTYQFQYAPYQANEDLTIISTNSGDVGNAHSEYIGPLAEMGLMGTITYVLIIIAVYYKGSQLYHSLPRGEAKSIVLTAILGFSTYVVHGFLNNFLDADKMAVPFWGFIAIIVAIDIYHKDNLIENAGK
tara:strand:+ start:1875 stop:3314 length:1440 start_codon:yes stop_codon:yes gene_type:complete